MKKIVIAPDSYKGSLSASEVCEIIAVAVEKVLPEVEIVKLPIADGGEGLVDALLEALGGEKVWVEVDDPLGRSVKAFYGVLPDAKVVIEMAAASGLPLMEDTENDILKANTLGTGMLIRHALLRGYRQFILGLGGSATSDGGAGAGAALGIRYMDETGKPILGGGDLCGLSQIDTTEMMPEFREATFSIACDVRNPLFGENGAAYVYSPQKGASPEQVVMLDKGLRRLAEQVREQTGIVLQEIPGTGAAGGLVVPFLVFGKAETRSGVDVVLDTIGFDEHLAGCDLVITGEGRTDRQSSMGKVLSGIGKRCLVKGVPVIALSGTLEEGYEALYEQGITAFFAATRKVCTLEAAMREARKNLSEAAEDLMRVVSAFVA